MANFDEAFTYTVGNEGGFTNDPADAGGATNWGITIHDYSRWLGYSASVREVREMRLEVAKQIYEDFYWKPLSLFAVRHNGIATAIFDQAVNRGLGYARTLQRLLRVEADGHVGPKTIDEINKTNPADIIRAIKTEAEEFYRGLAARKPSQQRFLKGWLNRAKRLLSLVR